MEDWKSYAYSLDDECYFELLKELNYDIYEPKVDSFEANVLKEINHIVKVFLGPNILNIPIEIKTYLIDNSTINGAICKCKNTYYISLFHGVISELKDFVLNFVVDRLPYDFFKEQFGDFHENKHTMFEFFKEEECKNYKFANYIANNILFFIIFHEIGHVFCGHQEISSGKDSFFMEANQSQKKDMLSQAKELMADFFGMINSLAVYDAGNHENFEEYTFNRCCYLISLYCLYIYFENSNHRIGTYEELFERSHPHPAVRLQYMLDFLDGEIEHELKQVFKVSWLTEENEIDILDKIDKLTYIALSLFSKNLPLEYQLLDRSYEDKCVRIRQVVQNIASDLYEETYRKIAIIKLRGIGRVSDKYVNDIIQFNKQNM